MGSGREQELGRQTDNAPTSPAQILWGQACAKLQSEIGAEKFASWVKPLSLVEEDSKAIHIAAPNAFCRDWVRENLGRKLTRAWHAFDPSQREIFFKIQDKTQDKVQDFGNGPNANLTESSKAHTASFTAQNAGSARLTDGVRKQVQIKDTLAKGTLARDTMANNKNDDHHTNDGFSTFVVGESNEVAFAVAKQISNGNTAGFNPFLVHGGYGVGKTHLLRAIAESPLWTQMDKRVRFLTAEEFVYDFVAAMRAKTTHQFKAKLRALDLLVIDDLQFLAGKDASQDEFFHTICALIAAGAQVVISADNAPSSLVNLDPRIQSRLSGGLICQIKPANEALRRQILERRVDLLASEYRDITVPAGVLDMIAHEICTNPRELIGVLNTIMARTALIGKPLNESRCREILAELTYDPSRKLSIAQIQNAVASYYDLTIEQLLSRRRTRNIVRPRQIAMHLSKHLTTCSLPMIGGRFGGRDHATVIHADKQIGAHMEKDAVLAADVTAIRRELMSAAT